MRTNRAIVLVAATLAVAACQPLGGGASGASGASGSGSSTAASSDSTAASDALVVAMSVHVERHEGESTDRAMFDEHVASLVALADLAERYGAVVSFELSAEFVDAVDAWGSTVIEDLAARGHGIAQHSGDRTTSGLTGGARVDELVAQRDAIEAHGVDVTYLSGACSDADWVEAAVAAGFTGTNGVVEYCLRSLDDAHLPAGMEWIRSCDNPAVCHDPLHLDTARKAHPWTTSASSRFLTDEPGGDLVIVSTEEAAGLAAMSQGVAIPVDEAVSDWAALLDEYLAARVDGRIEVLNVTLSIGPEPDWEVLAAMFAEVARRGGDVEWATVADVVAVAVTEAAGAADGPAEYLDTTPDLGGGPAAGTPGLPAPAPGRPGRQR